MWKSKQILVLLGIVFLVIIGLVYNKHWSVPTNDLKVYSPSDLNPLLVDSDYQNIQKGYLVKDFSLINQNADTITQVDYDGKIYVVDFFFTRCPSICPKMSRNMGEIQRIFKNDDRLKLLSISVTPELDSVQILKKYALKHNAISSKWNITTGDKRHIYDLARKSYFAAVDEGDGGLQDFIHTPNFTLVDSNRQIRGIYDGTRSDEIIRLVDDIKLLLD